MRFALPLWALSSPSANPANISGAILAVGGVTALDVCCARELSPMNGRSDTFTIRKSIQINRAADIVIKSWPS
jgi:hypothetical protein